MTVSHDPHLTELLSVGRREDAAPLPRRELVAEVGVSGAFLVAALAIGVGFDSVREWPADHALILTVLFAVALRVRFEVGAGYTVPVQLAFVPMLLLLPTPWVPLLVLSACLLERLPDLARYDLHPSRLLVLPGNAWFSIGPALVLCIGDAQTPDWANWPVYLAALLAQFTGDVTMGQLREWLGRGIPPDIQLRAIGFVPLIDALLSPVGLLAAFASTQFEFAYLLLVPPAALLTLYASERAQRVQAAIDLVETERAAVQSREALVAGASHELLTPLAVVTGLANRLSGEAGLDPERRELALASLSREVQVLRHLTRQFVDYTRVKAGQPLTVRPRTTELAGVMAEVAEAFGARADVHLDLNGARPSARADPDRLQQILMVLVSNAVKHAPGTPITLAAHADGDRVLVTVSDRGAGVPEAERAAIFEELRRGAANAGEGAGVGLFLARTLARAQGGELTVEDADGGGARFTVTLPAG